MDDKLKALMTRLGDAIDDSLRESEKIAEIIGKFDKTGYDVFILLKAMVRFNKKNDSEKESIGEHDKKEPLKVKLSRQDKKFLRSLKIIVDPEEE